MKTAARIAETRNEIALWRSAGESIGFVPTMGALHEGHLSLVRAAKARCDRVAVSIFVNPAQFGPNEDLSRYPRPIEKDKELLQREGVDLLFAPDTSEMYGANGTTWVIVEGLSEKNEGRVRPGHFRGVATIVAKLFNIVQPNIAFFGQKDAAQLALIWRMTRELRFPVEIVACPIVREADGLAMSSRNVYLSAEERNRATVLYRALQVAQGLYHSGERNAESLIDAAAQVMRAEPAITIDYVELLHPDTLEPLTRVDRVGLLAVAAKVGSTRLIDNILLGP
jgi:pantoate--beta-alanine ligase